ncbi:MAG: hypothetical protein IGS03_18455 [Candidatus Sericytochromatia bacterium]|nr:hypothetical protein [Candidatus Sericytochromatia bacterium]
MRVQTRFDRESAQLDTDIQAFIQSAVSELKAKKMQIFFVNQRNDDLQTTVTVTGLNAVDKPMVASMLDSGFHLIDTRHFGVESMAIDGFEPVAPIDIVQALGTHAREEKLVLPEDLAVEAAETAESEDLLWPFDFASATETQTVLSEVFDVSVTAADAEVLFGLQSQRERLAANSGDLDSYRQILGQIAAHYAEEPQDFIKDLMIAPQGRWLLYRQVLTSLQSYFSAEALQTVLQDKQLTEPEIGVMLQWVHSAALPGKDQISAAVLQGESALQKLDADFQPGMAPEAVAAFLKWYAAQG